MSKPPRQPPASGEVLKSLGYLVPKAEGEAATSAPVFRITSEVLDRADDRIIGAGGKTEAFNRNPVVLWNHDRWSPAIGIGKVYQENGVWLMQPAFDGIGELSKEIAAKVAAGTLRTCSIGFRILKHAYNDEGGLDILEWELLEVSITNIPCNPEAERVKNDNPQKNPPEPAPSVSKALEQADLDALSALLDAKLKAVLEQLGAIAAALTKDAAKESPVEGAPTPAPVETPKADEPAPDPVPAPVENPDATKALSFIDGLARRR